MSICHVPNTNQSSSKEDMLDEYERRFLSKLMKKIINFMEENPEDKRKEKRILGINTLIISIIYSLLPNNATEEQIDHFFDKVKHGIKSRQYIMDNLYNGN